MNQFPWLTLLVLIPLVGAVDLDKTGPTSGTVAGSGAAPTQRAGD